MSVIDTDRSATLGAGAKMFVPVVCGVISRLVASLKKAACPPEASVEGPLAALAVAGEPTGTTLLMLTVPATRSRTNTSSALFVSETTEDCT